MTDVTQILSQIESGDPSAADQLLPLVYEQPEDTDLVGAATGNLGNTCRFLAQIA